LACRAAKAAAAAKHGMQRIQDLQMINICQS
jgi:hypothetical protein